MKIEHYFEQQGSGSPIVFIHGSFATTSTWKKIVDHMAKDHHCISIKLPGHGGAPAPTDIDSPTIDTELQVVEQVVNTLTDRPIHMVGHSYGGVVALAQALKGNLQIQNMTLYEPVAAWLFSIARDEDMLQTISNFSKKYRLAAEKNEDNVSRYVIDFWAGEGTFEQLPAFIKDSMKTMVTNNLRHWDICDNIVHTRKDLENCDIPTRLVCGSGSNIVAHELVKQLDQLMPVTKSYVIDGASHFLVTSHVSECLSVLRSEPFKP